MWRVKSLALAVVLLVSPRGDAGPGVPGGPEHAGREVDCDLPAPLRVRNSVGTDRAGLCVWASMEMMARYTNCRPIMGVFDQMKTERGGGWPERVDRVMKQRAPGVKYRQYVGPDLTFIEEGINGGRPVCVTYGYGELYGMRTISHMVLCVHMDKQWSAIIDNNDPGRVWWMDTPEFKKRFTHPGGKGWAFYALAPPPPPVPHGAKP